MSFFKKNKEGKVVALFDIGSASVGGALAVLGRGGKPIIVYQTRIPIQFQDEIDFDRFVDLTTAALSQIVHRIVADGLKHLHFTKHGARSLESIAVSFASPWYLSQIKTIEQTYKTSRKITKELVGDILAEEKKQFINTKLAEYTAENNSESEIIDQRIVAITLNGYSPDNPYGKKATGCTLTVLLSAISSHIKERIEGVLLGAFGTTPVVYDSFGLIAFSTMRDALAGADSFLFCDVTGEVTDIGLVRNGAIVRLGSFPEGKRDLVRSVMKHFATTSREASSRITQYAKGNLEDQSMLKMEEVILSYGKRWQKGFRDLLEEFAEGYAIPDTVVLMADPEVQVLFEEQLQGMRYKSALGVGRDMTVSTLDASFLRQFVAASGSVAPDPFLAVMALFYDKTNHLAIDS